MPRGSRGSGSTCRNHDNTCRPTCKANRLEASSHHNYPWRFERFAWHCEDCPEVGNIGVGARPGRSKKVEARLGYVDLTIARASFSDGDERRCRDRGKPLNREQGPEALLERRRHLTKTAHVEKTSFENELRKTWSVGIHGSPKRNACFACRSAKVMTNGAKRDRWLIREKLRFSISLRFCFIALILHLARMARLRTLLDMC